MSWPVTMYYCTACDFEQGDAITWGTREYVLGNGVRIPVRWRMGWCESCNGLAAIEDLSSVVRIEEYRNAQRGLHREHSHRVLRWLVGLSKSEKSLRRMYEDNMEDAIDALEMLASRKNPPHCLRCLSTQVHVPGKRASQREERQAIFNKSRVQAADCQTTASAKEPEANIFRHPGCGGEILTREHEDGLRFALRPCIHRFTPEGLLIEKEDVGGYSAPDSDYWDALSASNREIRALFMTEAGGEDIFDIPSFLRKQAD